MAQSIQTPDGTRYEFPDGMPDGDIAAAIDADISARTPDIDESLAQINRDKVRDAVAARGAPSFDETKKVWKYAGKEFKDDTELNNFMQAELRAAQMLRNDSSIGNLASATKEATFGWGPDIVGQIASDPETIRQISALNSEVRPTQDFFSRLMGGLTGFGTLANIVKSIPAANRAVQSVARSTEAIPAMTQAGRAAQATGRPSFGTLAAQGTLVGVPVAVSNRVAEEGANPEAVGAGTAEGIVGGVGSGGLIKAATSLIRPFAQEGARDLIDQGVRLTPGQTTGGLIQSVENVVGHQPISGMVPRSAIRAAESDLRTIAFNRAVEPIGQQIPRGLRGNDAYDEAANRLSDAYNNILPHIRVNTDFFSLRVPRYGNLTQWQLDTNRIGNEILQAGLGDRIAQRFDDIVNGIGRGVSLAANNQGYLEGQAIKTIQSTLSSQERAFRRSTSPEDNQLAYYISELRRTFNDIIETNNPQTAPVLQAINRGWANLNILRRATVNAADNAGDFTPQQLMQAVRSVDSSVQRGNTAKGTALMQDLAGPAAEIMKSVKPWQHGLGVNPFTIGVSLTAPLINNRAAQAGFRALASRGGAGRIMLADWLQRNSIPAAPIAAQTAIGN